MIDIPEKILAQFGCSSIEAPKLKPQPIKPSIRLDKSGRRGKVVTLIGGLPRDEAYLKDLAKELKMKTGSGGTFYLTDDAGVIEIQGDHKEVINGFFRTHR